MGLIEGEPPRQAADARRLQTAGAFRERASDLVTAGALLTRNLGVRSTVAHTLGQPRPEPSRHPLTGGQLLVGLGKRSCAAATTVAALAPHQPRHLPRHRQIAYPHQRPLFDAYLRPTAARAAGDTREQLDLQVELLASPLDPA